MQSEDLEHYIENVVNCFSGDFRDLLVRFNLLAKAENLSVATRLNYVKGLKQFMFWLIKHDKRDIKSIVKLLDYDSSRLFLGSVERMSTRCQYARSIKVFYRVMGFKEVYERFRLPRSPEFELPEPLSEDEVKRILDACDSLMYKALIYVCYELGCRNHEIRGLRMRDIHVEKTGVFVTLNSTKSGVRHDVLIISAGVMLDWLNIHPRRNDLAAYIFYGHKEKLSGAAFRKALKRYANRAGIEKRVWPHLLRHSRAAEMKKENRISDSNLLKKFGWKNIKMITRYGELHDADYINAYKSVYGKGEKGPKEPKLSVLKPVECPRCHNENDATRKYCGFCGMVLSEEEAQELLDREAFGDELHRLLEDPSVLKKFKAFLEEL